MLHRILVPLALAAPAYGAPCGPAVRLDGEAAVVAPVRAALDRLGVAAAGADCPGLPIHLAAAPEGLVVSLVEAGGRRAARRVAHPSTAAALIDSWSRDEALGLLIAGPPPGRAWAPIAAPTTEAEVEPRAPEPPAAWALQSRIGGALGSDGSLWTDVELGACAELGPACVGPAARVSFDDGGRGDTARLPGYRIALQLLAAVDLPLRFGPLVVRPGVLAGPGLLTTGNDPARRATDEEEEEIEVITLRVGGRVSLAVIIADALELGLSAAADAAPTAHTAPYDEDGITLPGEPRWHARVGLGLAWRIAP